MPETWTEPLSIRYFEIRSAGGIMPSYASLVTCGKTVAEPINFREQECGSGKEAERFGARVLRRSCRWWVILQPFAIR